MSTLGAVNHYFTDTDLDHVEDDLVLLLEDCPWTSEGEYLRPSFLRRGLHQRGHTWARIDAVLRRLIERGVFELRDHANEHLVELEFHKYFTTRERWFAYVVQRRGRDGQRRPKRSRPGRPPDTNAQADQRLHDTWKSGRYASYEELARALGLTGREVELAVDRHRKRCQRKKSLAPDQR
jgi:hypothetical protein